jgi:hypothetical protein
LIRSPILVVIDDIDRLTKDEIRLVFRLVKANGDFPNLIFLLLFQRETAELALNDISGDNGRLFLEKISAKPNLRRNDLLISGLHDSPIIFEIFFFDRYFLFGVPPEQVSEAVIKEIVSSSNDREQLLRIFENLRNRGLAIDALSRLEAEESLSKLEDPFRLVACNGIRLHPLLEGLI